MKQSSRLILSLIVAGSLSATAFGQMSKREFERLDQGKITKAQAQHLVLREFPHASIKKCELRRGKEHSVWAVELVKANEKTVTKVEVDGRSGKFSRRSAKERPYPAGVPVTSLRGFQARVTATIGPHPSQG